MAAAVLMPAKATRLAIEPHNGLAPPRWQGGGHNHLGTVVAARTDHQDFTGQDWAVRVGARIDICAACVLYFYLHAWVDSALVLSAVGLVWGFAKLRSSWYSGIRFLLSPPHRVLRIRQSCASSAYVLRLLLPRCQVLNDLLMRAPNDPTVHARSLPSIPISSLSSVAYV